MPIVVWSSVASILLLAAIPVIPRASPSGPGDPGPSAACAHDARLVEADHFDVVDHDCIAWRWGYCAAYAPGVARTRGKTTHVRVCMDQFEAPNARGASPIVMVDAHEAEAWCSAHAKRLCTEYEWESACEGPDLRPFIAGYASDSVTCNTGQPWQPFNAWLLARGGDTAQRETDRLWQAEPSGARSSCVSHAGVYDLNGNAEEWIASSRRRKWPHALVSGHWAKPWSACRDTNDAHESFFKFYEVGFRCCSEPK